MVGVQPSVLFEGQSVYIPKDMLILLDLNENLKVIKLDSIEAIKQFVIEEAGYGVILESAAKLELSLGKLQYWNGYVSYEIMLNVINRPTERLSNSV
jgi:hypothetical protein